MQDITSTDPLRQRLKYEDRLNNNNQEDHGLTIARKDRNGVDYKVPAVNHSKGIPDTVKHAASVPKTVEVSNMYDTPRPHGIKGELDRSEEDHRPSVSTKLNLRVNNSDDRYRKKEEKGQN